MSFNNLPTELVWAISTRIHPDTIEAYGRTCHRIHAIASPLIREHRRLQNEFTNSKLEHGGGARLIYAIASRPWIKLYPETVELVCGKWSYAHAGTKKGQIVLEQLGGLHDSVDSADLRDLILGTELIDPSEFDMYLEGLQHAEDDFVFSLLIAILPNLRRIDLSCHSNKLERVKEMLRRIRNQGSDARRRSLTRLRSVRVVEQGHSNDCDLELLPLFAQLSGVEDLYAKNLAGMFRHCYRDDWATYPGASPSIIHITLETCGMSVEGLEMLMRRLRKLQSFRYVAHHSRFPLHSIGDLLKQATSSLRKLEVSASGASRYIGSLRAFTSLKDVTLDTDMLMRNGRMQRAVDVLPASIEKVTLSGNNLTGPQEKNFLMDLYRPAFTYPCLKSIGVEDSYGRRLIGKDRLKFQKEFHTQVSGSWMSRYG